MLRRLVWLGLLLLSVPGCGESWSEEVVGWELREPPSAETLSLQAEFGGSSCTEFERWQVRETQSVVEIRAVILTSDAEDCTTDLVTERGTVTLNRPLGDRRLIGCDPDNGDRDCRTGRS